MPPAQAGALCTRATLRMAPGRPTSNACTSTAFEMMAVSLALKTFLSALKGHHVLVQLHNTTVVAYINHQGGLRSRPLHRMTRRLLLWVQEELLSLRAVHVPVILNQGESQTVQMIQGRGRPLRLRRQLSLPNLFFKAAGCSGPRLAQHPSVCLPSDRPATPGYQASQGN